MFYGRQCATVIFDFSIDVSFNFTHLKGERMKTLVIFVLLAPTVGICQGFLPRWEMSTSVDVNSFSNSVSSSSGSSYYASLALRPGFYPMLGEGLSVEPELFLGKTKGQTTAVNLSGNISYSLGMGYWPFVPFVLAGYGLGDGIPFDQTLARTPGAASSTISVFNAGGGLKIMALGGRGLLRIEYRYQHFSSNSADVPVRTFARRLLVGFAVLL